MTTLDYLRETVPCVSSKVASARLHYDSVEGMAKLNASCYGVGAVEAWGSTSTSSSTSQRQIMAALEAANGAIAELRGFHPALSPGRSLCRK